MDAFRSTVEFKGVGLSRVGDSNRETLLLLFSIRLRLNWFNEMRRDKIILASTPGC